jgi:hypothetical protein
MIFYLNVLISLVSVVISMGLHWNGYLTDEKFFILLIPLGILVVLNISYHAKRREFFEAKMISHIKRALSNKSVHTDVIREGISEGERIYQDIFWAYEEYSLWSDWIYGDNIERERLNKVKNSVIVEWLDERLKENYNRERADMMLKIFKDVTSNGGELRERFKKEILSKLD